MRKSVLIVTLFTVLMASTAAEASRRAIRVDGFGSWDLFDLPSASCPGTEASSVIVTWNGYRFAGVDSPDFLVDTYCQVPVAGTLNDGTFFYTDEAGLRALIGPNAGDRVTAIRYALLDHDRFNFADPATGFQWTFYRFPAGEAETTIAGLYGLQTYVFDSWSYIERDGDYVWDGGRDGFDGQYFCFDGDRFIGPWSGGIDDGSDCMRAVRRIFTSSFDQ